MGRRIVLAGLLILLLAGMAHAPLSARPLKVGIVGPEPFCFVESEDRITGLSADVWRGVASNLGLEYRLIPRNNIEQIMDDLEKRALDVAIGPITITSRRSARVGFTQPYFSCNQGILARTEPVALFGRLQPLFTPRFVVAIVGILLLLTLVGTLVWLCERQVNPHHFPPSMGAGIGNGMWLALSAMTTAGYGDRVPVTLLGRFLTALWMMMALLLVSVLTASMTTTLTVSHLSNGITSPEQLSGRNVGVVANTTGESWAQQAHARVFRTESLADAIKSLTIGRVDAVVFDEPSLRYYLDHNPEDRLSLSPAHFNLQTYGMALHLGDPLVRHLNVALLSLAESQHLERITTFWLSPDARPGVVIPVPISVPSASPSPSADPSPSPAASAQPPASPLPSSAPGPAASPEPSSTPGPAAYPLPSSQPVPTPSPLAPSSSPPPAGHP